MRYGSSAQAYALYGDQFWYGVQNFRYAKAFPVNTGYSRMWNS